MPDAPQGQTAHGAQILVLICTCCIIKYTLACGVMGACLALLVSAKATDVTAATFVIPKFNACFGCLQVE